MNAYKRYPIHVYSRLFAAIVLAIGFVFAIPAQQPNQTKAKQAKYVPEDHRPSLFFKEDFKHVPANTPEHPVVQESIATPDIELKLYGQTPQHIAPDTGIWEIQRA